METTGTQIETLSDRTQFFQSHLDRVSRSFAFCIARLEQPLRDHVSLGYLLCRLLDTIEDANWSRIDEQMQGFDDFDSFLASRPKQDDVELWASRVPSQIPDGERRLLDDAYAIFFEFHELGADVRQALAQPIESMSAGMRYYQERGARERGLRLKNLDDVNQYCFFVAGVVGEMLTNLARLDRSSETLGNAFWFGLFLQKINLLKDQKTDELVGRFLVPERDRVRFSLLEDAKHAFTFLKRIPIQLEGFRLFCGWSLFLGLASLPFIDQGKKISRETTWSVLAEVEAGISENEKLETLFKTLTLQAKTEDRKFELSSSRTGGELRRLYRGDLNREDLDQIFPPLES